MGPLLVMTMNKEIILNLWAYSDARTKLISSLSVKSYERSGSDDKKLKFLDSRRGKDFRYLKKHPIPSRFAYAENDSLSYGFMHIDILNATPIAIFEDIIKNIETKLYPKIIDKFPLCVLTLLHVHQDQTVKAIITQSDSDWFIQQSININEYAGTVNLPC